MRENIAPCKVRVASETGRLRAVLLHKPGIEIERMTPLNAAEAQYSDILYKDNVDHEYGLFRGVLERWTQVYYVEDLLAETLKDPAWRDKLIREAVPDEPELIDHFQSMNEGELARLLIEGYEDPEWDGRSEDRFLFNPLYNLFFTRDASSTVFDRVLLNSMSFEARQRETAVFESIFQRFFGVKTLNAMAWNRDARTEGGDVQIAAPDTLCIGKGIRTNSRGIEYLTKTFARARETFHIMVQELPWTPESFIHLDMVFTFLGRHQCMTFEPMLKKQGLFVGKDTTLIRIDHGQVSYHPVENILDALRMLGWDMEPLKCGGDDPWIQLREQWHSGANFFALDDGRVMGYRRNKYTLEALDRAGFAVLDAEDIVSGKVKMEDYGKFVAVFPGFELPRAGGGARCMTMPLLRD